MQIGAQLVKVSSQKVTVVRSKEVKTGSNVRVKSKVRVGLSKSSRQAVVNGVCRVKSSGQWPKSMVKVRLVRVRLVKGL